MRILICEDDEGFIKFLKKGLEEEGHSVDTALNGEEGENLIRAHEYDLAILDVMMPKLDGIELVRRIRSFNCRLPIIFLTARDDLSTKLKSFDVGCDDYMTKPFSFEELLARMRALLKRGTDQFGSTLEIGDLILDQRASRVYKGGVEVNLTKKEYSILEYLMKNVNCVLSRSQLLQHVWGYNFQPNTNVVDVHIKSLRAKIDKKGGQELIKTVRGMGYMLEGQKA
ncbi:MAG: response regulator transcription factor [Bacteriovoracaceae bacterium]|jgi:DNA-binding response OmpR family regulator|nr:response regulator transcription factor [Bacteriovoracaceae bacterium]